MKWFHDVSVVTLDNGVTVINDHLPGAQGMRGEIVANVGSRHDPEDKLGLAHFAEHLVMWGNPEFPYEKLKSEIEDLGVISFNLSTADHTTMYWAEGSPASVVHYMSSIALALTRRDYDTHAHAIEQRRIITEMGNALRQPSSEFPVIFGKAVYGEGALSGWTGGTPEHLAAITLDDVRNFHRQTHCSDNMVVITSGPWTHAQAQDWAYECLSDLARGARMQQVNSPFMPRDVRRKADWLHDDAFVFMAGDLGLRKNLNQEAGAILQKIMSKSFKRLADDLGLYGIGSYSVNRTVSHTQWCIETQGNAGIAGDVLRRSAGLIADAPGFLTQEAVDRAKAGSLLRIKAEHAFRGQDPGMRVARLSGGYFHQNDAVYSNGEVERMERVTRDDVMYVAERMASSRIATGYAGMEGAAFTTGAELQGILRQGGDAAPAPTASASLPGLRM